MSPVLELLHFIELCKCRRSPTFLICAYSQNWMGYYVPGRKTLFSEEQITSEVLENRGKLSCTGPWAALRSMLFGLQLETCTLEPWPQIAKLPNQQWNSRQLDGGRGGIFPREKINSGDDLVLTIVSNYVIFYNLMPLNFLIKCCKPAPLIQGAISLCSRSTNRLLTVLCHFKGLLLTGSSYLFE